MHLRFSHFPPKDSRHYLLATLLCWLWIHLEIEQWFKETPSVIYFTNIALGWFVIGPVNKKSKNMFAFEQLFNQAHCVRYFTNIHLGCCMVWLVNKADTICYLLYFDDFGYIWSFRSSLCRYTVLLIHYYSLVFLHDMTCKKSRHYLLDNLLCW